MRKDSLKRSFSNPNLNINGQLTTQTEPLAENQLKKLIETNLTESDHQMVNARVLKTSEDFMAEAFKKRYQDLEVKFKDQASALDSHYKCLSYIYNCFKVRFSISFYTMTKETSKLILN